MLKSLITNWVRNKALNHIKDREPDFVIGPKGDPYMLRWWFIPRNHYFNIYIHMILHDDDDRAMHDHPWASLSLLCQGNITEHYKAKLDRKIGGPIYVDRVRHFKPNDWVYRSSKFAHRLEIDNYHIETPITVFMTGPRVRDWGFHCDNGWVPWKEFVAEDKDGNARGCGEVNE